MKYELNHDAVAKQIFEKATVDMKARRKVEQLVKNNYELYLKRQALMTQEQLEEVRPFRKALNLSKEESDFVEKSEKALVAAQRRKFFITLSIIATLAIMGAFAAFQWYKSAQQQRISEAGRLALLAQQQLSALNFNDAFCLAQESLERDPHNNTAKDIQSQIFHRPFDNLLTPLSTATVHIDADILDAALSTDGSLLALVMGDSLVEVFDITQNVVLKSSIPNSDSTFQPVFSPDNTKILTLKSDSILQISRFDTTEAVLLRGHTGYIRGAKFFNNDTLLTWANDGFIKLWNTQGQFLQDIGQHANFINSVEISSDSIHILSTDDNQEAIIWSLKENENEFKITHLSNLKAACFWNKDSILLFGSEGIETWSRKQKKQIVRPLPLVTTDIENVEFSAQGDNLLYINDKENTYTCVSRIHQYFDFFGGNSREKAKSMKMLKEMDNMRNFEPADFLNSMIYNPSISATRVGFFDNNYIWTVSEGSNEVYLRNNRDSVMAIMAHPEPVQGVAFSQQNRVAVTYSHNGILKIWKHNATKVQAIVGIVNDLKNGYSAAVYFTPDNRRIITTGQLSPMKWYTSDGQFQKAFDTFYTEGVAFSPTEQSMVAFSYKGEAVIFDSLGEVVKKLAFDEKPKAVHFSPDGSHFLMYSSLKVGIWNSKGDLQSASISHKDQILDALFTPDCQHILTLSRDSLLSEWTLDGKLVRPIVDNERKLTVEFSPDGKTLVTGSSDGLVSFIDYKSGKILGGSRGEYDDYIQYAHYFPDGKKVLISDAFNQSTIISPPDGKTLKQGLFGSKYATVKFLNNGNNLLVMSSDAIGLWTADNRRITTFLQINERPDKPTLSTAISKDNKRIFIAFNNGTARQYLTPEGIADWMKQHPDMRFKLVEKERYAIQ